MLKTDQLPDLNRLRVFFHVYKNRSIQNSAKELFVTQSAVSQTLKALESQLSTPLFHRMNKSLVPTDAADQLFATVDPFLSELQDRIRFIHRAEDHPMGRIRIGAPLGLGTDHLISLIAKFRRKFPDVTFDLKLGLPNRLLHYVLTNQVDFAIADDSPAFENPAILRKPLMELRFQMLASKECVERELGKDRSYEALAKLPFVTYFPDSTFVRMWFQHHFHKKPSVRSVLCVNNVHAVMRAVRSGMGAGLVPEYFATSTLAKGQLLSLEADRKSLSNQVILVHHRDRFQSFTERIFTQSLGHLKGLVEGTKTSV